MKPDRLLYLSAVLTVGADVWVGYLLSARPGPEPGGFVLAALLAIPAGLLGSAGVLRRLETLSPASTAPPRDGGTAAPGNWCLAGLLLLTAALLGAAWVGPESAFLAAALALCLFLGSHGLDPAPLPAALLFGLGRAASLLLGATAVPGGWARAVAPAAVLGAYVSCLGLFHEVSRRRAPAPLRGMVLALLLAIPLASLLIFQAAFRFRGLAAVLWLFAFLLFQGWEAREPEAPAAPRAFLLTGLLGTLFLDAAFLFGTGHTGPGFAVLLLLPPAWACSRTARQVP